MTGSLLLIAKGAPPFDVGRSMFDVHCMPIRVLHNGPGESDCGEIRIAQIRVY